MSPKSTIKLDRERLLHIYDDLYPVNAEQRKRKKEVADILWLTPEEIEEREIEKQFQKYVQSIDRPAMLRTDYFRKKCSRNNTAVWTWKMVWAMKDATIERMKEAEEEKNRKNKKKPDFNPFIGYSRGYTSVLNIKWLNASQNIDTYKQWLWGILSLSKAEIEKFSQERIDLKANQLLSLAINHITRYFVGWEMKVGWVLSKKFRSSYFSEIHALWDKQKVAYDLMKLYFKYWSKRRKREKILERAQKNPDITEETKLSIKQEIQNLIMAQFEIQRIFALAVLYNDREKNHTNQNLELDKAFLMHKIWEITEINNEIQSDDSTDWLNTVKNNVYIKRTTDWTYLINDKEAEESIWPTVFNSTTLVWNIDFYSKEQTRVNIRHIEVRNIKDADSAVDKIIMKWLSSFSQILDQKWIIIVVDDYKDADNVEMILSNMLWTWETSWTEPLIFSWQLNDQTSSSYKVKKWIMKVVYWAEAIRKKINELETLLKRLKNKTSRAFSKNIDIRRAIYEISALIDYFKKLAEKWTLNLEMEVQIFDMQNYIKAEVDEESPAFHWDYKERKQILEAFPKLFPTEIYWEQALRDFIIPVIKKRMEVVKVPQ